MNDAALTASRGAVAQVRVREPAGERTLGAPLTIGGEGMQIVVPGTGPGLALRIERRDGVWLAQRSANAAVCFDGQALTDARDLRRGDVLGVGDAQLIVADVSRTLLSLEVVHLVGNATIPPVGEVAVQGAEGSEEDLEIGAVGAGTVAAEAGQVPSGAPALVAPSRAAAGPRAWRWAWPLAAVIVLAGLVLALLGALEPVRLEVHPAEARVRTPGTWISVRSADRLFVLPGRHVVRAELEGYAPSQTQVAVRDDSPSSVRLRLEKLPGRLSIDTGGVAAAVSVDGVQIGRAPGEVELAAGSHTITLRAPRYLDHVSTLTIEGAGVRQELRAAMKPSWGTLAISANPAGARLVVDGREAGTVPASVELDAGVRRIELSAPGLKTWQSSVVVKAGETLRIGPITLGQPDARLTVRSTPEGAEVAVAGSFRGRTPVSVDLPPGMSHEIVVSLPGHASWTKSVFAEPGRPLGVDARLEPVLASVSVEGEPAAAEIFIDGVPQGRTPRMLKLTAVEHRLEIRKEGFKPFATTVAPAVGLERAVRYRLVSADRATELQESAPTIETKTGYVLKLVPPGRFTMGSERREQGRRPNEGNKPVVLQRPFYIGVTEVTNAQFRRFRSGHTSGFIGKRSFDLDDQPVTRVSWEDAVEYSNWLSEQEGLAPAYERRGATYALRRPVTSGYRLPTEAEWEYAARHAGSATPRRFVWGNALPVAAEAGNLAGAEAADSLPAVLTGYRDEYPAIAPVGKFAPSALGLHDLAGNVSEWVNDYYLSFVDESPATDPLGPEQGNRRVIRGASWQTAVVAELRLAWREGAAEPSQSIGFRLARYAE